MLNGSVISPVGRSVGVRDAGGAVLLVDLAASAVGFPAIFILQCDEARFVLDG